MPKEVPCLTCTEVIHVENEKIIACVCTKCQKKEDVNKILKSINYKMVKDVLTVKQINQIKEATDINEFGEII